MDLRTPFRRRCSGLGGRRETAFEAAAVGLAVADGEGRLLEVNPALAGLLGYGREALVGRALLAFVHPDDSGEAAAAFGAVRDGRTNGLRLRSRLLRRDGEAVPARVAVSAVRDRHGRLRELVIAFEPPDAEAGREEFRYRELVEQLPLVTYVDALDEVSSNLYTSPQVEALLGYTPEEWREDPELFVKLLHPDDRERVLARIARSNATGEPFVCEYRLVARDGRVVWLRDEAVTVRDEAGRGIRAQGCLLDITARKLAEEELERSRAILEAVEHAAESLLRAEAWTDAVDGVLAGLGRAAEASRAYLFRNESRAGRLCVRQLHEWVAPGVEPTLGDPALQAFELAAGGSARWIEVLGSGGVLHGPVTTFPEAERAELQRRAIRSLLVAPVAVGDRWWGFLGFDECRRERVWGAPEVEALRTAAGILGAAIQRRRAEEELRETSQMLRAIVDASPAPIVGFDAGGHVILWNPAAERVFGWTAAEVLGAFNPLVDETQREDFLHWVGRAIEGQTWRDVELVRRRRDGAPIHVSISSAPLPGASGQIVGMVSVIVDITERRQAQQALQESEERHRTLVQNIPGAVYRCLADADWTMEFLSDDIEDITGYPASDFLGNGTRTYASVIHPDDRARVSEEVDAGIRSQRPFVCEYRIVRADGEVRWLYEKGSPVFGADGRTLWLDGVIFDVSERRRVEEELERERDLMAMFMENTPDHVYFKDRQSRFLRISRAAARWLGLDDPHDAAGRSDRDFFTAEHAERELEKERRLMETGEAILNEETKETWPDGSETWVVSSKLPLRDRDGAVVGTFGITRDVTEQKRMELERERLLAALEEQNERLVALDRLKDEFVALVSHELRTPLTSIMGYLELVLDGEGGPLTDDQVGFLEVIRRNSERLLRLVGDLLFVAQIDAGKLSLDREPVDVEEVLRDCLEAARPRAAERGVELRMSAEAVPPLEADRIRLAQVLDNLVSNAIKFTPAGGSVDVGVARRNGSVLLTVTDTGIGISEEQQQRLFERFFRAESAHRLAVQGTGLGLTIVKAIVEAHGGTVTVSSEVGRGTTVAVELPMAAAG